MQIKRNIRYSTNIFLSQFDFECDFKFEVKWLLTC